MGDTVTGVGVGLGTVVVVLLLVGAAVGAGAGVGSVDRGATDTGAGVGSVDRGATDTGAGVGSGGRTSGTFVGAPSPSLPEAAPAPDATDQRLRSSAPERQPEVDNTVTRIRVHPNGSATWVVAIRTRLANETDVADYRAFQERFRNDTASYLGPFAERIRRTVRRADNATGREMTAVGFRASTRIERVPRQWGVVEYRFRWTAFARTADGAVVVGDVFRGGYFLAEADSLVVEAPDGYRVGAVEPVPDRRGPATVRWTGQIDFADGRPRVRLAPNATDPDGTPTTPGNGGGGTDGGGDGTGSGNGDGSGNENGGSGGDGAGDGSGSGVGSLGVAVAVLAAVVLLGGLLVGLSRRRPDVLGGVPGAAGDADGRGGGAGGSAGAGGDGREDAGSGAGGVAGNGAGEAGGGGGEASGEGEEPTGPDVVPGPAPDPELATDEELVVGLLERNGGRMRQADVGDRLDWSASKTSRVLSAMDEEGTVEKIRLGNENVIDLSEGEVDGDR